MDIRIPFFGKPEVDITNVLIAMRKKTHSLPGMKVNKKFTYNLRFSNTEESPMRVLAISVSDPFTLVKINHNLPIDLAPAEKAVFELRCETKLDYTYSGPLKIAIEALPIANSVKNPEKQSETVPTTE